MVKSAYKAIALSALLVSCGGSGGGGSENGPASPAQASNPKVQVYSAKGLGFNMIPHTDAAGNLLSCTLISNATGEAAEISPELCQVYIVDAQRIGPRSSCQLLQNNTVVIGFEPSLCTRMVQDGQPLPQIDESGQRAAANASLILQYFIDHHQRRGLDNQNSDNVSIVHIGQRYNNAFYDPEHRAMLYGDGDGQNTRDFTLGLDVAAHEMTHGVTSHTARFLYRGESGALDEATADFFGMLADGAASSGDWQIGEKVMINGVPFRDIQQPGRVTVGFQDEQGNVVQRPYPSHVSQLARVPAGQECNASNDLCFVHFNSTLIGHAGYRMVQALGQEKAEKIYYLALTQYFGPATQFQGAANNMVQACQQLYDRGDCLQVAAIFTEIGLTPSQLP